MPTGKATPYLLGGRVWLTEGILKADIASDILGEAVLASSGQRFEEAYLESYLRALDFHEVIIALDEDVDKAEGEYRGSGRRNTEAAKLELARQVHNMGFRVRVASWNPGHGKGLDDFLLANHGPKDMNFREPGVRKRQTHQVDIIALGPQDDFIEDERPELDITSQREELLDKLEDVFENRKHHGNKVFLLRHLPGVGKSTTLQIAAERAVARDKELHVTRFVPTHEVGQQSERDRWTQIYGRTASAPQGVPCRFANKYSQLNDAGTDSAKICGTCPAKALCQTSDQGGEPYYLAQFGRESLCQMAGNHFLSPHLVLKKGSNVLVLDDVDLDSLALSAMTVTEADLLANLSAANSEPDPEKLGMNAMTFLRPAIALFHILLDFRSYLLKEKAETRKAPPEGAELVWELWRWCAEQSRGLEAALESAGQARQPNPLDGATIETARIGPKAVVTRLVEVLATEIGYLKAEKGTWNSRFHLDHGAAGALAFKISRRVDLATLVRAYDNRPIIIANADVTREQAARWFPSRDIEVIEPRSRWPENARVWQYPDQRYGKTSLLKNERLQKEAIGKIREALSKHPKGDVGVITHKSFESVLKAELAQEKRLKYLHFHGQRSNNDLAGVRALVILGTPHPNESDLIRQTEALYHDGTPLLSESLVSWALIEDVSGQLYRGHHRYFVDPRLQEQLESRTNAEMQQSLYRCRPLNLDAPQQGSLLDGYQADRAEIDIYVFSTLPLGIPVHVVSRRDPVEPAYVDDVVKVALKIARGEERKPSQKEIWETVTSEDRIISYRQTLRAIAWLKRRYGSEWLRELLLACDSPRPEVTGAGVVPGLWRESPTLGPAADNVIPFPGRAPPEVVSGL